jgi:hypothetical protein
MALASCVSNGIAYVHVDGSLYYRIEPRYPYIYQFEYSDELNSQRISEFSNLEMDDLVTIGFLFVIAMIGILCMIYKLTSSVQESDMRYQNVNSSSSSSSRIRSPGSSSGTDSGSMIQRIWGNLRHRISRNKNNHGTGSHNNNSSKVSDERRSLIGRESY